MSTFRSESVEQTLEVGRAIASLVGPGDVIALDGELGAGKTQFVRGLAEGLGTSTDAVSSPTYVLVHEYEGGRLPLVHVDAYRLRSAGELEEQGFEELRQDAVTAVEWSARVADVLGEDRLEVFIEHAGGDRRVLTFTPHGGWTQRASQLTVTPCSICSRPTMAAMETYPFCSKRCRQIDLGRWLSEDYKISRPIEQRDLDEE